MFRRIRFYLLAVVATMLAAQVLFSSLGLERECSGQVETGESPVSVARAEDVISKWDKNQHLYVKGDLGVSPERLGRLEAWLDENGPHWTIVLMQNAEDEFYLGQDGRKFYKMDAAEYALSYGLPNRTEFGDLVDEATHESDGAIFVLFLKERELNYFGSDMHDRRRLGRSKWIGDLDREAIRAMKNGGRVV